MTTAALDAHFSHALSTRYLDSTWSRQIRSLLFHTYRDNPMFRQLLAADRPGYEQRIRACTRELANSYFADNMPVLGLLQGDRLLGVAFICGGGYHDERTSPLLWRCRMILSIGYQCTASYLSYHRNICQALPEKHCYLLPLIGVHPEFRRQGHGRKLLEAAHDLCDLDQSSCGSVVSLNDQGLIPFFQSMGYREMTAVSQGNHTETLLFRNRPE